MTPRELTGWTPAEKHLHYDAEGTLTGWTVVERESRIDDTDAADLMALARFEREVCSCGYHPSIAEDEANTFTPESRVCPVCAGETAWKRVLGKQDEAWEHDHKDADPKAPRPSDGRRTWMRMVPPTEAPPPR